MAEALRIYIKLIRISMQSRMQYRADFIIGIMSVLVLNAVNLGLIGILVGRFTTLNGWNMWDMVFLYSMFVLGHSLYSLFFWHLNQVDDYIIRGTMDQFLIRPISPFVQLIGREIQYIGFGDVIVGCVSFYIAYVNLHLNWSLGMWLFCLITIVSGTVVEVAIRWIIACTAFWTGRSSSLHFVANRFTMLVQQYPIDIFGTWFRLVVTFIPLAFINYYPSVIMLGKTDKSWSWLGFGTPAVAVITMCIAALIWRAALQRYTSSGS